MSRLLASLLAASALAVAAPVMAAQPAPAAAPALPADPGTPAPNFSSERIGVTVLGEGPDVILIPGLSSLPAVWSGTMAAVPGYRYHLIHVSGFAGRPAGANAEGTYLVPVADEIARYIREARLGRPAVVGHSMGGSWTILLASRHPDQVGKAMVVDPWGTTLAVAPEGEGFVTARLSVSYQDDVRRRLPALRHRKL